MRLINFDWSGTVGTVRFPAGVNREAFGAGAISLVSGGRLIIAEFDWRCLAVIFSLLRKESITAATAFGIEERIHSALSWHLAANQDLCLLLYPNGPGDPGLDLAQLGDRLQAFYSKKILSRAPRNTKGSSPENSQSPTIA